MREVRKEGSYYRPMAQELCWQYQSHVGHME